MNIKLKAVLYTVVLMLMAVVCVAVVLMLVTMFVTTFMVQFGLVLLSLCFALSVIYNEIMLSLSKTLTTKSKE